MPDPEAKGLKLKDQKHRRNALATINKMRGGGSLANFGDMERFKEWPDAAVDLLVGGTPCQSFSVAGLRSGLDDPRGNLALVYLGVADRYRPRWVAWENVPGVLSSNSGRDFGAFLGGLAQLGYGWAYRVLDAQYIRTRMFTGAVPQRRRRVFVVGYLGDWRPAHAVLFDAESLLGNPPPRRQTRKSTAHDVAGSLVGSGRGTERAGDTRGQDPVVAVQANSGDAAYCLTASAQQSLDAETETLLAHTLRGRGFDASEDGSGRGTPLVAHPLTAGMHKSAARMPHEQGTLVPIAFDCTAGGNTGFAIGEVPGTLRGDGHGNGHTAIAFSVKDDGSDAGVVAPTLRAMGHGDSHANAGGQAAVAFQDRFRGDDGRGYDRAPPASEEVAGTLETVKPWNVALPWAVRRLIPIECERLQGFPDDYTNVPYRGKNTVADGPRYKAIGNSMAVNAMEWLGDRIALVDAVMREREQ
jgi:DNA (cytosine-5)-methyltransferase 1